MESSTAGEGGDGDTETLLPTGGPAAVGGWPQPQPRLARTGGGPSLARGIPCALLCPSSAFFSFLLRRCFTEELYLPPHTVPGAAGGAGTSPAEGGCVGMLLAVPWLSPAPSRGVSWEPAHRHPSWGGSWEPAHHHPSRGGSWEPAHHHPPPGRLQECRWEQGLQGMMENGRANGGTAGTAMLGA